MLQSSLIEKLSRAKKVLIAGAGGGFDVFAGVPLAVALRKLGKEVFLANLTFTYLPETDAEVLRPHLWRVTAQTTGADRYFPERALCQSFARSGVELPVFCFEKTGVEPLRASYRWLIHTFDLDAVMLVDGGTDILMRGDEGGLGTPEEDMSSLAAVNGLDGIISTVSCLGFGVDAFHGVCNAHCLENIAALEREGAFLGSHSVQLRSAEGVAFQQAVELAHQLMPARQSIVNGSVLSALEGRFGDAHRTERTRGSKLFINPLMSLYWHFDLRGLAARSLYLPQLEGTQSIWDVSRCIEAFRKTVKARPYAPVEG